MTQTEIRDALTVIHSRKSVRHFTDQPVSREMLEILLRAAMAAPSAVNKQPWAFVAITNRKILDELGQKLPYAKMLKQAQAAVVVCGDMKRALADWEQEFWIQDCSAATQNLLLAAEATGLGAVWTAVYPAKDRMQTVREVLHLPDSVIPLNVVPIGWPKGSEPPKIKWHADLIHWEKW